MSTSSDVDIRMRLRGARETAQGTREVRGELRGMARDLSFVKSAGAGVGQTLDQIGGAARRGAFYLGGGFTAALGFGVRAGLKFNATMEQSNVAFTNFLGSAGKAKAFTEELYQLAARTPFEFTDLTNASVKLMGFGMSAKRSLSLLRTLGDAVAGVGGGAEEIQRVVVALGQIQAKGKLSMEELNQLSEARIPALKMIRDELGMTKDQFAQTFTPGHQIEANRAINALQRGLDKAFGGQAARQARTFNGQLSTLRDYLSQTAGIITQPAFQKLRDDLFPGLTAAAQDIQWIFSRTDITQAQKWESAINSLKWNLGPFAENFAQSVKDAHLDAKLGKVIEWAVPRMAQAGAAAAPKVALAFVNAFNHSGVWGKLFIGAVVAKRLGLFSVLGKQAADGFAGAFRRRRGGPGGGSAGVGTLGLGTAANPMWVRIASGPVPIGAPGAPGGKPEGPMGGSKGKPPVGRPGGRFGFRGAGGIGGLVAAIGLGEVANQMPDGKVKDFIFGVDLNQLRDRANRTAPERIRPGSISDRLRSQAPGARVDPLGPVFHTHVHIDGKEVATAVGRATDKARNRK